MSDREFSSKGAGLLQAEDDYKDKLLAFQEAGKTILNGFFICNRMAQLYDPSNEAFQRPLQALKVKLDEFLAQQGEMKVMFSEGQIYLNDTRLKVDSSSFEWVNELINFFTEKEIGGLKITGLQSRESMFKFFQLLCKVPKAQEGGPSPRDEFATALDENNVRDIVPLKLMALTDEEDEPEAKGDREIIGEAVTMYIAGLMAFKNLARGRGGAANMLQMTRVVQSLTDAETKVGGDLLSLVTIKNCEHFMLSHAMNVCILSIVIGRMLPLSKEDVCDLALGAMLHDIGKFSEAGSDRNYQNHPYESFRAIMQQGEFSKSLLVRGLVALDHHISFDGKKGFPHFRIGQRPHLFARIAALADAYDCLTTPMEEEKAMLPDVALRSILKRAGTIFDPVVAQVFIETLGKYPVGTLVETDSGDLGIVMKSGRGEMRVMRPIVLLVKDRYGNEIKGGRIIDLAQKHPQRKAYMHSIVCTHDPGKLDINVSGYLLEFLTGKRVGAT